MVKIGEVFTPGTQPSVTYNDRQKEALESKVQKLLSVKGKIGVITGKSKVGKTVLIRKLIDENRRIEIQPQDLIDSDLSEILAMKVKVPKEIKTTTESESDEIAINARAEVSAESKLVTFFSKFKAKLSASGDVSLTEKTDSMVEKTFINNLFDEVVQYMIENDKVLVFDDFHYNSEELQKKLIHRLKDPLSRGLVIIIILIPRERDLIGNIEDDMKGRMKRISVPSWNEEELKFIATQGFSKLNINVDETYIQSFVENSFKNPQLMQEICSEFCVSHNVLETQGDNKVICYDSEETLRSLYYEIDTGESSIVSKLRSGKKSGGIARKDYELTTGDMVDVYSMVMRALGERAHQDVITWKELYSDVKSYLKNPDEVQQIQITNTLNNIIDLAKESNPSEPVLTYENQELPLDNALFSFALRWTV